MAEKKMLIKATTEFLNKNGYYWGWLCVKDMDAQQVVNIRDGTIAAGMIIDVMPAPTKKGDRRIYTEPIKIGPTGISVEFTKGPVIGELVFFYD